MSKRIMRSSISERIEVSISAAKANEWAEAHRRGCDKPVEHAFKKDWFVEGINITNGVYTARLVSYRSPTALEVHSIRRNGDAW